jgi:hypothetical protein
MELLELRNNMIYRKRMGKWDASTLGDEFASLKDTAVQIATRTGETDGYDVKLSEVGL